MKRALKVEPLVAGDDFIGFVLGGDSVSEHEWGIDGIKSLLGIPRADSGLIGIDKRKSEGPVDAKRVLLQSVTLATEPRSKKTKQNFRVLYVTYNSDHDRDSKSLAKALVDQYRWTSDTSLFGAWDSDDFVVISADEKMHGHIDALAQSIIAGDVAAWVGRFDRNPFSAAGLAITIVSRIPAEHLEAMRDADIARNNLIATSKATGIESRLEAAGLRWFALSPRLANEEEAKRTEHKVVFWLNPRDQSDNNFGWFTVEELDQWAAGEGPVPKHPKATPIPA